MENGVGRVVGVRSSWAVSAAGRRYANPASCGKRKVPGGSFGGGGPRLEEVSVCLGRLGGHHLGVSPNVEKGVRVVVDAWLDDVSSEPNER